MTNDPTPLRALLRARFLALVAVSLLASAAPLGELPRSEGDPELPEVEITSQADIAIRAALEGGRISEARALLRKRLSDGASSCTPYRLAVDLAVRTGDLDVQIGEWEEKLRESRSDILVWAYAVALSEIGEDRRALHLLSHVLERGVPCLDAYRRFVRVSQRLRSLKQAEFRLRQLLGDRPRDPYLMHGLAFLAEIRGEGRSAMERYFGAIQRSPLPQSYHSLAALLLRAGELRRALDVSRMGMQSAFASGRRDAEIDFTAQQAELFAWMGEAEQSDEVFEKALRLASSEPDQGVIVRMLLQRSLLESALGDPERALAFYRRAETIPYQAPTKRARAQNLLRQGENLIALNRPTAARTNFETTLTLAREVEDPLLEFDALLGLVHLQSREGSSSTVLQIARTALEIAVALEDGRRQAAALLATASLYESMGRFDRAIEFLGQVLARTRRDGDWTREVLALSNLSLVHLRLGLTTPALRFAQEATERSLELRDFRIQLGVAQSLAAALAGAGLYSEAEQVFRRAFLQSERLADAEIKGLITAGLGRVLLALGEDEEAEKVFRLGLDLARQSRSDIVALQSRSGLGLALRQQGRLPEALAQLEASLSSVESSRSALEDEAHRLRYAETRAQIYSNLTGVLVELDAAHPARGYGERAFSVNERSRSRALLDVVARVAGPDARPSLLVQEPLSSREIRETTLRPGELLLEYALGERGSTLWAISATDSRRYPLPRRSEIEADVRLFLEAVRTPPRAPYKPFGDHLAHGDRLYRTLLAPAEAMIGRATHAIIAPHGALNLLPFEALVRSLPDGTTSYFVEEVVVSYSPSASALHMLRDRARRRPAPPLELLGMAQSQPRVRPGAGREFYPPIPFAAHEIETISSLFPFERRRIYTPSQSNEAAFKKERLNRYRILHFAAHAEANFLFPERSAIVLGASEESSEDGLLSMSEVLDLELASELVVLSGCETGLGQVLEAEGTLGLTWAFLSAGSKAVAVSLWNVNDRSTSTMMTSFYRALAEGGSVAESLAGAKREMLRSSRPAYRHPFFWAPFVLVGVGGW